MVWTLPGKGGFRANNLLPTSPGHLSQVCFSVYVARQDPLRDRAYRVCSCLLASGHLFYLPNLPDQRAVWKWPHAYAQRASMLQPTVEQNYQARGIQCNQGFESRVGVDNPHALPAAVQGCTERALRKTCTARFPAHCSQSTRTWIGFRLRIDAKRSADSGRVVGNPSLTPINRSRTAAFTRRHEG